MQAVSDSTRRMMTLLAQGSQGRRQVVIGLPLSVLGRWAVADSRKTRCQTKGSEWKDPRRKIYLILMFFEKGNKRLSSI